MNPETLLCPVTIPARRQQEHSCEMGTAECAWSRDPFKPIQSRKSLHLCLSVWKRGCIPVLSSLPQLQSPQGTTGTFTKIRKAVVPNSESCWVGCFLEGKSLYNLSMYSKNKVASGFLEMGHIYELPSEGSSDFLPLSRVCCGMHRHGSGFDHRKEVRQAFDQTSLYFLPVTIQNKNHQPSRC